METSVGAGKGSMGADLGIILLVVVVVGAVPLMFMGHLVNIGLEDGWLTAVIIGISFIGLVGAPLITVPILLVSGLICLVVTKLKK